VVCVLSAAIFASAGGGIAVEGLGASGAKFVEVLLALDPS
jgi:hypothetical protein